MPVDRTRQKLAFAESHAAHGNVRRAMRDAEVASPTTAYRWLALMRTHGHRWTAIPSPRPRAISQEIEDAAISLAEAHPHWGKSRIARELARLIEGASISPNGVRTLLLEAGLWHDQLSATGSALLTPIDHDELLQSIQRGLALDLFGQPLPAVHVLNATLWQIVLDSPDVMLRLLQDAALGSWCMRGILQLGHALIDSGRWRSAAIRLTWLDRWLGSDESRPSRAQLAYVDVGPWLMHLPGLTWRRHDWKALEVTPPGVFGTYSLHHDDIWLETQQYLALIDRARPGSASIDRLDNALHVLRPGPSRPGTERKHQHYRAILSHDLAVAQTAAGWWTPSIHDLLCEAGEWFMTEGNMGMAGSTAAYSAMALLSEYLRSEGRPRHLEDRIHGAAHHAIELAARDPTIVLRTNVMLSATRSLLMTRAPEPEDLDRLHWVARETVARSIHGHARSLLGDPLLRPLIGDDVRDLEALR